MFDCSYTYSVGTGRYDVPADDGAIGSTGVKSGRIIKYGGGRDLMWRWTVGPYTRNRSTLHRKFILQGSELDVCAHVCNYVIWIGPVKVTPETVKGVVKTSTVIFVFQPIYW